MKKVLSKIIAIALTAVMTTCLTACEDERNIPTYGTGLESEADTVVRHNLSPTAPVETEPESDNMADGFIRGCGIGYDDEVGEYIWVTAIVTSLNPNEVEIHRIVDASVYGDDGLPLSYCQKLVLNDGTDDPYRTVNYGDQVIVTWSFVLSRQIGAIDINLLDNSNQEVIDTMHLYLTEE